MVSSFHGSNVPFVLSTFQVSNVGQKLWHLRLNHRVLQECIQTLEDGKALTYANLFAIGTVDGHDGAPNPGCISKTQYMVHRISAILQQVQVFCPISHFTFFSLTPFCRDRVSGSCFTGQLPGIGTVFILASLQICKVQRQSR